MSEQLSTIQWISNALYILLAVVAMRIWLRDRSVKGAMWVAAAFMAGGLLVGLSLVMGPDQIDPDPWSIRILVFLLLALPLALHRFVITLHGRHTLLSRLCEALALALAAVTLAIPSFPGPDEEPSPTFALYTLAFLGFWLVVNGRTATVLVRASQGQPNVIRRRLQVLAAGAVGLSQAVVLPALVPDSDLLAVIGGLFGALSGVGFLLGFQPPRLLRARWREPEELALHEATQQLMLAARRDEVADTLLPCMTALVGARGSALLDRDDRVIGTDGDVPEDPTTGLDGGADDVLVVPVQGRQHVVLWTSPWSPLLGEDERRLLDRLTVLANLALDRADLFEAERRARADAERANDEVEAFVATITHDLRNPLTTIGGMADLLMGPLQEDVSDRAQEFLRRIRANTTYMGALVDDILALAEVGQGQARVETVDLQEVAESVSIEAGMRQPEAEVAVRDLPVVLGDPVRLRRLVENVVSNAIKHGGRPDIRIDVTAARPEADWVELRFLDNGQGVPPESAEAVFGVFQRLEGRGKGTGLGLAICRKMVEQFGGSMWFATPRAGADVRIRIPSHLVLERPAADDPAPAPTSVESRTGPARPESAADAPASLAARRASGSSTS